VGLTDVPDLTFHPGNSGCDSQAVRTGAGAGALSSPCASSGRFAFPGVPSIVSGRGVRVIGKCELHVDDYRTVDP